MPHIKRTAVCLLIAALFALPGIALSDPAEERVAQLETQVQALESRISALESQFNEILGQAESSANEPMPFAIGDTLLLKEGLTMKFTAFEFGNRFNYYPADGLTATNLDAKDGYVLLCLYVIVENHTSESIYADMLLNAELKLSDVYNAKARQTFYYINSRGFYSGDLKTIASNALVEGCLIFGMPEEAQISPDGILFQMIYGDSSFQCTLHTAMPDLGAAEEGGSLQ